MKNPFKMPSISEMIAQELEDSKRELLIAESTLEAWEAKRAMLIKRIERLNKEG